MVHGEFIAPTAGNLFLSFDNAYSKMRGKKVQLGLDFGEASPDGLVYGLVPYSGGGECTMRVTKTGGGGSPVAVVAEAVGEEEDGI